MNFKKHISTLFLIVILFVLYSCNTKTEEQQIKINNLQTQLTVKDSIINVISEDLDKSNHKIENSNAEISTLEKQINAETLISFTSESTPILNTTNFIKFAFKSRDLENTNIMTSIWNGGAFINSKQFGKARLTLDDSSIINYIWSSIDRSPENLKKLITPKEKQVLYLLFKNNNLYKDSGASSIVKALLTAYTEVENNESIRHENDLTNKMYSQDPYADSYSDVYEEIENTINDFASEEVKGILSDENYYSSSGRESKLSNRVFFVYTFWIRRYKEKNQTLVYELLKELHQNVSKENSNSF